MIDEGDLEIPVTVNVSEKGTPPFPLLVFYPDGGASEPLNPEPLNLEPHTQNRLLALSTNASITFMFATASSNGVGTTVSFKIALANKSP